MNSSISPSKHLFGILLVSLVISYAAGAAYTLLVNPEIRFWREAYATKIKHARKLDFADQPKTVFVGGSSCAFQIEPKILHEQFDLPSVNMGLHAGMGARAIIALVLPILKPGDHLILNMEPHLLSGDLRASPLGLQILVSTGSLNALSILPSSASIGFSEILLSLRPGLRNIITMLGKVALGRPSYRYTLSDLHENGFLTTAEKGAESLQDFSSIKLSSAGRNFLSELQAFTDEQNISVRYLLPWICIEAKTSEAARNSLRHFSEEVSEFLPQICDGYDGVHTDVSEFSDTSLHLTENGAKRRTKLLGKILSAIHIR